MLYSRLCPKHRAACQRYIHRKFASWPRASLITSPRAGLLISHSVRGRGARMSALTQKALQQLDNLIEQVKVSPGSNALAGITPTPQVRKMSVATPVAAVETAPTSHPNGVTNATGMAGRVPSVKTELEKVFRAAIMQAFPGTEDDPVVVPTKEAKFGDYQCNNAMKLFNQLKGKEGAPKNPRAVGEAIVAALPATPLLKEEPSLAGPGFVNLQLHPVWLAERLRTMLIQGIQTWAPVLPYKRAVVDFSSPNVAKEMHVGHLRSTIIGETISRTIEFCGVDTLRLNHVGDWGTQFGMLIQYIIETREGGLEGREVAEEVSDLQTLYRASKKRFDEDEEFKLRAREAVRELQGGNPAYVQAWQRICDASRKEFDAIYSRLDVQIQWRGESFYNPLLAPLVKELMESGTAEESEGAKVIFVDGIKVPLMIQKSDGGFGYGTTDMAAVRQRIHEERCDLLIYVTDAGQAGHFEQVFKAGRKAGFIPQDGSVRIEHVGFGVVLNEDGTRIKTRSGETIRLAELLDEARDRCKVTIKERRPDISDEEVDEAAAIMGYGAVKYADLKNNRSTNYKFSFDAMLNLVGNTAVYLQYAHARMASIARKAKDKKGVDVATLPEKHKIKLEHPREVALAVHLVRFPEAVEDMLEELYPNRITDYVYELSDRFTGFYTDCPVVDSKEEASRLMLCEATAIVMRQCFSLLGIKPLYRI